MKNRKNKISAAKQRHRNKLPAFNNLITYYLQPHNNGKYLFKVINFYFLWLLVFFLFRVFVTVLKYENNTRVDLLLGAGFWADIVVISGFFLVHLALNASKIGRVLQVFFVSLLLLILFVNALFISWAHFPLDFSYLGYLSTLPQLWFSAGSIVEVNWQAVVIAFAVVLLALVWLMKERLPQLKIWKFAPTSLVLAIAIAAFFQLDERRSGYLSAVSENVFFYSFKNLFSSDSLENKLVLSTPSIRQILDNSAGISRYLYQHYPLLKERLAFGKRQLKFAEVKFSKPPNIVLIFMESFRANDIGSYNPQKKHLTPVFDNLAKNGWLWQNFYANGVQTSRGALASLTSTYSPLSKSIAMSDPDFPILGLGEILAKNGYQAHYYHNGSLQYANKTRFFKNMGFKSIVGGKDLGNFNSQRVGWGIPDHLLFARIADDLNKNNAAAPIFLTAFTVSTHHPWKVPLEKSKIVQEDGGEYTAYQNCIHYADFSLGILFEKLKPAVLENTIFIITADTAQPMGEHEDNFALLKFLYEENVRIPFLIYSPKLLPQATTSKEVASQVDIAPTLLDLLGIKADFHNVGRSLLAQSKHPDFAYFSSPYTGGWVGLRLGYHKFFYNFQTKKYYLYDLQKDPNENTNIAPQHQSLAQKYLIRADNINRSTTHLIKNRNLVCNPCLPN